MDLISRYVHQVGRRLPRRLRADVEVELRSLLLDALEKRTGLDADDETAFSEDDQVAVLEEFGPPAQMAAKYRPQPRYIIGPKVYNLYLIVVAAVIGGGLIASVVSTAVTRPFADSAAETLELLGQGWMRFVNIALGGIGSTTLVFAVLERVIPDNGLKVIDDEEWDPRNLPAVEDRNQIKPAGLIVETGILALLLIAFIAFPNRIGAGIYYDGGWHVVPSILSPAFFSIYLPLIEIHWILTIILNLVLLRQGRWQLGTRIADLLVHGFGIFVLVWLLLGPSVLDANAFNTLFPFMQGTMVPLVSSALKLAFLVALIVTVIETATKLFRTLRAQARAALPLIDAKS